MAASLVLVVAAKNKIPKNQLINNKHSYRIVLHPTYYFPSTNKKLATEAPDFTQLDFSIVHKPIVVGKNFVMDMEYTLPAFTRHYEFI